MIPRLGDGNYYDFVGRDSAHFGLENDSPSRGRKLNSTCCLCSTLKCLENDSPSRGRKHNTFINRLIPYLQTFRK